MASDVEVAWAAGLFEGEGCFTQSSGHPVASLGMTDEDIKALRDLSENERREYFRVIGRTKAAA